MGVGLLWSVALWVVYSLKVIILIHLEKGHTKKHLHASILATQPFAGGLVSLKGLKKV